MRGSACLFPEKERLDGAPWVTCCMGWRPTSTSGLPSAATWFTDTAVTPYPCVKFIAELTKVGFGMSPSATSRGPSITSVSPELSL